VSDNAYCSDCGHITTPMYRTCPKCEGQRNRAKTDSLAEVIRELKDGVRYDIEPDRHRELVRMLGEYGHLDIGGLLGWIENAKKQPKQDPRKQRRS
jgi:hypothetical protein